MLAVTHALSHPDTAEAAALALRGAAGQAEVEGLVELLTDPPSARAAWAALAGCPAPTARAALLAALGSPHASARLGAAEALHRSDDLPVVALTERLRADPSWPVRRAALRALAGAAGEARWGVLLGADDPHWRVRHALVQVLLGL